MKTVVILGSTGSIGCQTIEVIKREKKYKIIGLTCGYNTTLLYEQIKQLKSVIYFGCLGNFDGLDNQRIKGNFNVDIIKKLKPDIVVNALVGITGLEPSLETLNLGLDLCLANKESLVIGGDLILKKLKEGKGHLYPIDSEHSAISKCLAGNKKKNVQNLILTASGGAFRDFSLERLNSVKSSDALKHPTWKMGVRITIDCATMVNKAFEVIEAHYLFDMPIEKIQIQLHDESKIHSMVRFHDGTCLMDFGASDMRTPISLALNKMKRTNYCYSSLDFSNIDCLNFRVFDPQRYPLVQFIIDSFCKGGTSLATINAADEVAIDYFIKGEISYKNIEEIVKETYSRIRIIDNPTFEDIMYVDKISRDEAIKVIKEIKR